MRATLYQSYKDFDKNPSDAEYVDFRALSQLVQDEFNLMAVAMAVAWWKFLKFMEIKAQTSQLVRVLARASGDIRYFIIILVLVFTGFCVAGYMGFGVDLQGYRTPLAVFISLFRGVSGDINFHDLYGTNRVLGPLFYLLFFFFAFFVLLNMFLAIVNDSYYVVRSERVISELTLKQMLWGTFGRKAEIFNAVKVDESIADPVAGEAKPKETPSESQRAPDASVDQRQLSEILKMMSLAKDAESAEAAAEIMKQFDIENSQDLDREEVFLLKQTLLRKMYEYRAEKSRQMIFDRMEETEHRLSTLVGAVERLQYRMAHGRAQVVDAVTSPDDGPTLAQAQQSSDRPRSKVAGCCVVLKQLADTALLMITR